MSAPHNGIDSVMRAGPVIAVVTVESDADASTLANALSAGGVRVLEVTLRTRAALAAIEAIAAHCPDVVVGAGTVLAAGDFAAAANAGARFTVSPGFTPQLAAAARAAGVGPHPYHERRGRRIPSYGLARRRFL